VFAAAITMPVTNANMQENSTMSIASLVMVRTPYGQEMETAEKTVNCPFSA
jgi:hypothetical protein